MLKPENTGERQYRTSIAEIKPNHSARYRWAIEQIEARCSTPALVLDAAAGVGYGSRMLAEAGHRVHAADNSRNAADWYQAYFRHGSVTFSVGDLSDIWLADRYDAVVSIETIEHIDDDRGWIDRIGSVTNLLIGTVPNQDVVPFDKASHPFHYRHYTRHDVIALLDGWRIEGWYTQYDKWHPERSLMRPGVDGMTLGFVAVK